MAQWLDFKGKVVDSGVARTRRTLQFFYLVEDIRTSVKYPVIVTVERARGRGKAEQDEPGVKIGDTVRVTGRIQSVIGVPLAGMKMIEKSDVQNVGGTSRPFSNVVALIPEEMTKLQD